MNRVVLGVTVAILTAAAQAQAQAWNDLSTRTRHWDFSVQTRYTGSRDFNGEHGSNVALDDDLGWGFAFDYNVNEKLSLGFTTAWRNVNYNATVADNSNPTQFQYYNSSLYTSTIGINGTFNLLPKRFTPYAAGGVGWTFVDTNIVADYQTGCWWDPWWGYVCDTYAQTYGTDAASFALGGGLRLGLSPTVFARIGYEHNWLDLDSVDGADIFRVDFGASF